MTTRTPEQIAAMVAGRAAKRAERLAEATNDQPNPQFGTGFATPPIPDYAELLHWIGEHIKVINVNGRKSDKFCILCKSTKLRPYQCRHDEIWAANG